LLADEPLPAEVRKYLRFAVANLLDLAQGRNFRNQFVQTEQPPPRVGESVTPESAMELVPEALFLRRRGMNAFKNYAADRAKMGEAAGVEVRRWFGEKDEAQQHRKAIQQGRSVDMRSVSRRLKAGRELLEACRGTKRRG
jgi:hypothetical protein